MMTNPAPIDDPTAGAANGPTESDDSVAADGTRDDPAPIDDTDANANTEAAKYRRRLRDTETQLSTTAERLAAYQRRHAEQIIGDVLATPADLFEVGQADLTAFLDDNGDVRTEDILIAAAALADQRPQLGKNYQPPFTGDFGQGVRSQSIDGGPSWAKALAPERRR